eukprot:4376574-Heterocapsa_arctica.AAC.1
MAREQSGAQGGRHAGVRQDAVGGQRAGASLGTGGHERKDLRCGHRQLRQGSRDGHHWREWATSATHGTHGE